MTDGWNGIHPLDRPVVVVTHHVPDDWVAAHPDAPFTFVTDGLEAALERARAVAGDKDIGVNGGEIARQCLELGLLDQINVDLVPVLLGDGVPFFDHVKNAPVFLDEPTIIEGSRVTHLHYVVRKS